MDFTRLRAAMSRAAQALAKFIESVKKDPVETVRAPEFESVDPSSLRHNWSRHEVARSPASGYAADLRHNTRSRCTLGHMEPPSWRSPMRDWRDITGASVYHWGLLAIVLLVATGAWALPVMAGAILTCCAIKERGRDEPD